jgi:hypothetical protein
LNTPAKTGLPGSVKPENYRPFVDFSIAVFDALAGLNWHRLSVAHGPLAGFTTVESFPLSAWRVLGLKGLSAKSKAKLVDIDGCRQELARLLPLRFSEIPSHDELQATVAGLAGLALEVGDWENCAIAGVAPSFVDGFWREGFIVNATPAFCRAWVWHREGRSTDSQDSSGDHPPLKIR